MATVAPEMSVLARDEAFEQLYRKYVQDVYHYSLALLRNPADAEDVTQTTFMNAYRAFRRGEQILKPQNWLIKIAHNVARTRYSRMSRRVKEVPLEDHLEQLALPEDERPNVEGVLRALGRLPFNQRAALVMRELEGRSYAEIADTLGVSVAAVETLIFRARRSLRVRAAALKSIAAVPLPSSLTQLFAGGGGVAGGIGTGVVVKAAVALMAGALATGLGGDRRNSADAAASSPPTMLSSTAQSAAPSAQGGIPAAAGRLDGAKAGTRMWAAIRSSRTGQVQRDGQGTPSPGVAAAPGQSTAASQAAASPSTPSTVASTATTTAATTTAAVQDTAASTVGTVQQTVGSVVPAVPVPPVSVPPVPPVNPPTLPVEPPPLPKLP